MKKLLILISLLTGIVFAGECERLYREFVKRVPGQDVTICRVNV